MVRVEVFKLANCSRSFATRARGREVASLVAEFASINEPREIVVDWNGVNAASPSFIDEFVGGIQSATHGRFYCDRISFALDESGVADLVGAILRRRGFPIRFKVQHDKVESI